MRAPCGLVAVALGAAVAIGCAPLQSVPLDVGPQPLAFWVDGERQSAGVPDALRLRADRPHLLFFRRDGYRPERVLLESDGLDPEPRLRPARVVVRLRALEPRGRALQIELDEEASDRSSDARGVAPNPIDEAPAGSVAP